MANQPQSLKRFAFGPFEVNAEAGELSRGGIRIRLSGQPLQILLALLANPGKLVTREQLRAEIWTEDTFVDFEHSLNTAINKLRRALGDSADNPRYIETVTGSGYRFIGALDTPPASPPPSVDGESAVGESAIGPAGTSRWWWLAALAGCLLSFAVGWWLHAPPAEPALWQFKQLTKDTGLSDFAALSPDGKLVAYASDSSLDGEPDLYIRQTAGGQPIRLTSDGSGNTTPDFSPDGSKIVFRSSRGGGGIYAISAFGSEPRLVARDGFNPKFSPDGLQVAYWVGNDNVDASIPGSGAVWVVSLAGGPPQRIARDFTAARDPIWSPDSKHLLLVGYTSTKAFDDASIDWWLVATDGTESVRTGAYKQLVEAGLQSRVRMQILNSVIPSPECWSPSSYMVLFSSLAGDAANLWELGIAPGDGIAHPPLRRVTAGAGNQVHASCSLSEALVFTQKETKANIWSIPLHPEPGSADRGLERITQTPAYREYPAISKNGAYVAFSSDQSGRQNIWVRQLATGKESQVSVSPFVESYPVINAAGTRVAFSAYERDKRVLYMTTLGGVPEKLCEGCLRATDWSQDESKLLVFTGNPYQINLLDIGSRRQTPLLTHPKYSLLYGRFSPDNRWISFTARTGPNSGRIAVAPTDGMHQIPESAWIEITPSESEDWANWSSDGNTLYFTSRRDGHSCLWGQRLDGNSRRPVGAAFAVQHFHGRVSYDRAGWSAAAGRIAMALKEDTGNIWMMSRSMAH